VAAGEQKMKDAGRGRTGPAAAMREGVLAGDVGVWRWDIDTDRLFWAGNVEAIHRLPPKSFDATLETFASNIHPEDRERVLAALRKAAEGGQCSFDYRLRPGPLGAIHWVEARGTALTDAAGRIVAVTGICQEVTVRKTIEAELAMRARQQEAVAQLGESALSGANLDEIFGEAARLAADLAEAEYAEILELSPERDTLVMRAGVGWNDNLVGHPVSTSDPGTVAGEALRSRRAVVVNDFGAEEGIKLSERRAAHGVQSGAGVTIGGSDGNPFGVLAIYCRRVRCTSATDVRFLQSVANVLGSAIRSAQDQERKELLIGELRHRVGNLFSLVQALHRQTGQNARDAHDLELKFGARLAALASAHSLILEGGWQRASLRSLLEKTLAPYIERVTFSGADVKLPADAAFSFSMALHELATNANKYGALSGAKGRLLIESRTEPDALGRKLVLVWKETDGPPPPRAEVEGFGSKLIAQVVERQLGGLVTREVEPDGLRFTIEFPVG
jgi:two-component sensor histidine kinase